MIPIWALVLLIVFGPGIIKMIFDGMSGQRGGSSIMGMKMSTIVSGIVVILLLWFLLKQMGMMY